MNFSNETYEPVDREYFLAQNSIFITLGKSSYIGNTSLNIYPSVRPKQILVGRYSSLAWDIKFITWNHVHVDVVSTYHFQVEGRRKKISAYGHPYTKVANFTPEQINNHCQTIVGSDVWIGCGTTIRGGVKIGNGSIIGTNSMVTKDIPPYAIAVGNPIKIIKYRFDEETIKKFMAVKWWNWDVDKVLENAPLMNDPEEFLKKHYSPELEIIPEDNTPGGGKGLKTFSQIRKIFILLWGICILLNRCGIKIFWALLAL